jgi:hypothetical protein
MYETCRMLGEQREAELLREAQRLQAGAAVRPGARRHRARLDSFRARARRATRKVEWLPGSIGRSFSVFLYGRDTPAPSAGDPKLPVDELSTAEIEVALENEEF